MSYKVKINNYEGPFDLLLHLVNRQKIDIGSISITELIDQYLEQISHMQQVNLDIASDFMLVAVTLLKIKTDTLLKINSYEEDKDIEEISPSKAKEDLINRLLVYKQFKNATNKLNELGNYQQKMHPRLAGPDTEYLDIMPDFLDGVSIDKLGEIAAKKFAWQQEHLLEAKHIAARPIPVVAFVKTIYTRIKNKNKMKFSQLIDKDATLEIVVVNFLAMLELYKRSYIDIYQTSSSDDIMLIYVPESGELNISEKDIETW